MNNLNEQSQRILTINVNQEISSKYIFVISIDFGTSRSGFACSGVTDGEVRLYTGWPLNKLRYPKTPSQVIYDKAGNIHYGWEARTKYGELKKSNALKHPNILKRFKLHLLDDNTNIVDGQEIFSLTKIISDYLNQIRKVAIDFISAESKAIPPQKVLWVLTMPAGWGDRAISRLREIAQQAGLISTNESDQDRLILMPEPEAAIIYCQQMTYISEELKKTGCRFMVVDAGGGTVDVASYEVKSRNKLAQLSRSVADECGSEFLNNILVDHLARIFPTTILNIKENHTDIYYGLLDVIEEFKCDYDPDDDDTLTLRLPTSFYKYLIKDINGSKQLEELAKNQHTDDTVVLFKHSELRDEFIAVYKKAATVAQKVAKESLGNSNNNKFDFIFFVGGFSKSPSFQKFLKEEISSYIKNEANIVIPRNPEEAVVVGATAYGLDPTIIHSRRAKLTYGAYACRPFEEGKHLISKKYWNEYKNGYWCKDLFNVFVYANEEVEVNKVVRSIYSPREPHQDSFSMTFYSTPVGKVEYVDEVGVYEYQEKISMAWAGQGFDRKMEVSMYFGKTEVEIIVKDLNTNSERKMRIKLLTTYS